MKFLVFLFTLLLSTPLFSQEIRIAENEVNKEYVLLCNERASTYKNKDSVSYYYNKALLIAEEIKYWEGQVVACKGLIALHKNDKEIYDKLRYAILLTNIYEKNGTKEQNIDVLNQLGEIYYDEHLYAKAVEQYKKAVVIDGEGNDGSFETQINLIRAYKKIKECGNGLALARKLEYKSDMTDRQKIDLQKEKAEMYHALKAYQEELSSYEVILTLTKSSSTSYLQPIIWNNIGYTQKYLKNYKAAKSAFTKVISKVPTTDYLIQGGAYYNLGLILYNEKDLDSALLYFKNAERAYDSLKALDKVAQCINMQAMTYFQKNDEYNAFIKVKEAIQLEKENKLYEELGRSYEIKSMIHQGLYEYEMALDEYKKYLNIRDSLLTEDRSKENKSLYDQYKVEQLEKQLRMIWSKNELDDINLAKERAEKEADKERYNSRLKEDQLRISQLQNNELRAKEELQKLQLLDEKLNRENTERKLALSKRENELKKLALEKERLIVASNQREIQILEQNRLFDARERKHAVIAYENKIKVVAGILFIVFMILLGILIAYRQLRKRKQQIEAQNVVIADSKALIEKEKEKSEGLLLNILPSSIAEELKLNGSSKPKLYNEVSVGFTDFSGFTMISEKLDPEKLVEKLDEIFYAFDMIIEQHGLQRIKTIGDAYMFAGGVPEEMEDHAVRTVEAAIEMRNYIQNYNDQLDENEPKWNIRIGVNTGQIVAGVIGIKKFAYDIWGDAVNIAARMESSGKVGKVNVSGSTYELIKDQFSTEFRGKVEAKNKGAIDMYFVESLLN